MSDEHQETGRRSAVPESAVLDGVAADVGVLGEDDLRRIATRARSELATIVAASELARVDGELVEALALPPGKPAMRALRRVLTRSDSALAQWFRAVAPVDPDHDRAAEEFRHERHLLAAVPEQVLSGEMLSVLVKVDDVVPQGWHGSVLRTEVPPEGVTLTIVVSAYGLVADGALSRHLHVPAEGTSELIQFGLTANQPGRYGIVVHAFLRGTSVGQVSAEVNVTEDVRQNATSSRSARMGPLRAEPGEVTLVVGELAKGRYRIQLVGDHDYPIAESELLTGDSRREVTRLEEELNRLALGLSEHTDGARLVRLRNLGIDLWRAAVPETIRTHFWEQRDRIGSVSIQSDADNVPWELVYPSDGEHDSGFLVEQFPVLRRTSGQTWRRTLSLDKAAFVVTSPGNAQAEVEKIRTLLGDRVLNSDVSGYVELVSLIQSPDRVPDLLHFSCHNTYLDESGSRIELQGGPFQPSDVAPAAAARSLATRSPLVFLNACRSAKPQLSWARPVSWASNFMAAGAAVFVGSLWDIRSSAAEQFAESFYEALVTRRLPLGEAAKAARLEVKAGAQDGDPTWLAYTVYGPPSAKVRQAGAPTSGTPGEDWS